jgi:hypothetical protein
MKTAYLVLILIAAIVLGWAIHYYSDRATFGPAGAPSSVGMTTAPDARVV